MRSTCGGTRSLKRDTLLTKQFYELAIGARFVIRGRRIEKIAMSIAEDAERVGHIFLADAGVTDDSEALLLPPVEAARWKRRGGSVRTGTGPRRWGLGRGRSRAEGRND